MQSCRSGWDFSHFSRKGSVLSIGKLFNIFMAIGEVPGGLKNAYMMPYMKSRGAMLKLRVPGKVYKRMMIKLVVVCTVLQNEQQQGGWLQEQ